MLHIVGTPIGNMEDCSIRAAKTLLNSEIILAEDTREAGLFIRRINELFNLKKETLPRLISYYKDNEFQRLPEVIDLLKQDKDISLISQSGMPLISDPGSLLIKTLIKENIKFDVIPGPSASTTAAVYSGFSLEKIFFIGFLPKKESEMYRSIDRLIQIAKIMNSLTVVFYESPFRIEKTLKILSEKLPECKVCVCREMTKKFEEILYGKPGEIKMQNVKGEFTIVLELGV